MTNQQTALLLFTHSYHKMTNNQTQREIKFRAWDIETETMEVVSWIFFYQEADEFWGVACVEYLDGDVGGRVVWWENGHKQSILMQYTWLKDNNGKEIYEGDFYRYMIEKTNWRKKEVIERFPYMNIENASRYWEVRKKIKDKKIEIIGNIYENPELLSK